MKLGWLQEQEDTAYLHAPGKFLARMPESFDAPEEIDPRGWLKIEDQGQVGSCAGHAMSSCCEVLNHIDSRGGIVNLSRMFAYLMAQKCDGLSGDKGATISGAVKAAKLYGICQESTFPYPGKYVSQVPEAAVAEAASHKVKNHESLSGYDDCFKWLATGTGVIEIGIPWVQTLAQDKTGVIDRAAGQEYGGHALAIVGYTKRKDSNGRQFLIMANSHGTGWGKNGFAEIAPALFDQWGRDSYSEMIGITDLEEYGDGGGSRYDWYKNNPMV